MSKVSIGALLAIASLLPLGCEAIVGNVHGHDDAGAGGVAGNIQGGEAGMLASSGVGNAPGESGAGGTPAEAGASGAGLAGASGETGDSGAAGASPGCMPVDDGNACTDDVCVNGVPTHTNSVVGTVCTDGGTRCDGQGACVECVQASDCSGEDTACQTRTCTQGACGFTYTAVGTALPTQTVGDCKTAQCDGHGAIVKVNNDADLPVDGNACTSDVCTSGAPTNPNQPSGTVCGTALLCDDNGTCVGCNTASDCGTNTECKTFTCSNTHQCGVSYTASGTAAGTQTAGNCQKSTCDGAGNISNVPDATDTPADDGNACTDETCVSGAPQHPAKSNGTTCSDGNGCTLSDTCQSGACTAGTAKACTALDECHTAGTCTPATGLCSNPSQPAGTITAAQTSGNCQQNQCDGAGNIVSQPDNTDVPADDGLQCTSEVCTGGVPSHPPKALNTACNQGGTYCNGGTSCVQCTTVSQCTGADTGCHIRTCISNQCGFSNPGTDTAVGSGQTPGDCQKRVCDGNGGITSVDDPTDLPADDHNDCTNDVCGGTPLAPYSPVAANTPCNGGSDAGVSVCDGAGTCY